jgi:hypothetical protein
MSVSSARSLGAVAALARELERLSAFLRAIDVGD